MIHVRTPAKAYDSAGKHTGPGPWLNVIREACRLAPAMFGAPTSVGPWWAGGCVEEYEDARVIHRPDGLSVSIVSKTERGAEILAFAAGKLGIDIDIVGAA